MTDKSVVQLSNGKLMPIFGLGTFNSKNEQEMTNLIRAALEAGYRQIDTAKFYGNEKMIGNSLKTIFAEGKYKRTDIFLVTKVMPFKAINMEQAFKEQLNDLQVEFVDLLILHFPFAPPNGDNFEWNHKPVHVVWSELEDLFKKGLTKSLGVSNFNCQSIVDLLSYCEVKPVVNQIELHVFHQQKRLVEFLKKIHVQPVAYSPMAKYTEVVKNEILNEVARKNNVSVAKILLSFLLSQGIVVIPKTEKAERLKENLDAINFKLSERDIETLRGLESRKKILDVDYHPGFFKGIPIFD